MSFLVVYPSLMSYQVDYIDTQVYKILTNGSLTDDMVWPYHLTGQDKIGGISQTRPASP